MGDGWGKTRQRLARGRNGWIALWGAVATITATGAGTSFSAATARSYALLAVGVLLAVFFLLAALLMFAAGFRLWPHSPLDNSDNAELLRAMDDHVRLTTDQANRLHAPLIGQSFEVAGDFRNVSDGLAAVVARRKDRRLFLLRFDEASMPDVARLRIGQRIRARGTLDKIRWDYVSLADCELRSDDN